MIVPSSVKQTPIRLPEEIKEWVKDVAAKNGRSLNTEVVLLLKKAMDEGKYDHH